MSDIPPSHQGSLSRWEDHMVLDGSADGDRVGLWLDAVMDRAWLGSPDDVVVFVASSLSSDFPPDLGRHIDGDAARAILRGMLVNADSGARDYREATLCLAKAGVLRPDDMSAVDAVKFLCEHRANEGAGAARSSGFYNPVVRCIIESGMRVGDVPRSLESTHPRAAVELAAACRAAYHDASDRAEAMTAVAECAAAGMDIDVGAMLSPCYSGRELLAQARKMKEQHTGLPEFLA